MASNPHSDKIVFPVNFFMRDATRQFTRNLANAKVENPIAFAALLWLDFGIQQKVWRPFRTASAERDTRIEFLSAEPTVRLMELGVGWSGDNGALCSIALASGFMDVTAQGNCLGLELADFAESNPQFMPGYQTMQQKGAARTAEGKRQRRDDGAAEQQRQLIEQQQLLTFEVPAAELQQAIAFIMQLDRIGQRKPRLTREYRTELVERAVQIRRASTPLRIEKFTAWLLHMRPDVTLLQGADAVIANWDEYVNRSGITE